MIITLMLFSGCSGNEQNQTNNDSNAQLANPASSYCIEQNGSLEMRENENGEYGVCIFENFECEEWAFYRGECPIIEEPSKSTLGEFCGGIKGFECETGLKCEYDGDYPDAGGRCVDINKVTNFEECVTMGNPIMESYPRQCIDNNITYYEQIEEETNVCTMEYAPVCGVNGRSYSNSCMAGDVEIAYEGECQQ